MLIRTFTYNARVQSLHVNSEQFQPREGRRVRRETTECTHGLSDCFKVGQKQLKARQSRKKQVYLGLLEPKSVIMSAWPIAGLLGCGLYLFLACN